VRPVALLLFYALCLGRGIIATIGAELSFLVDGSA